MSAGLCCTECFSDEHLQLHIIPDRSNKQGDCDYCSGTDVHLLAPNELKEEFELLRNTYIASVDGRRLVDWFQDDWKLFVDSGLAKERIERLLVDIFEDSAISETLFQPAASEEGEDALSWNEFRKELKHRNRWFPNSQPDLTQLTELFQVYFSTSGDDLPATWYRARVNEPGASFSLGDLCAPPEHKVGHGRANPVGIPYLYVASTVKTAASEVRPSPGETITIAKFRLNRELNFVDLRAPRRRLSPFSIGDEKALVQLRNELNFLEILERELSQPVVPNSAHIDYLPSQYLCEFLKSENFGGVLYQSSLTDDGFNLALFNPNDGHAERLAEIRVESIDIATSEPDWIASGV